MNDGYLITGGIFLVLLVIGLIKASKFPRQDDF